MIKIGLILLFSILEVSSKCPKTFDFNNKLEHVFIIFNIEEFNLTYSLDPEFENWYSEIRIFNKTGNKIFTKKDYIKEVFNIIFNLNPHCNILNTKSLIKDQAQDSCEYINNNEYSYRLDYGFCFIQILINKETIDDIRMYIVFDNKNNIVNSKANIEIMMTKDRPIVNLKLFPINENIEPASIDSDYQIESTSMYNNQTNSKKICYYWKRSRNYYCLFINLFGNSNIF